MNRVRLILIFLSLLLTALVTACAARQPPVRAGGGEGGFSAPDIRPLSAPLIFTPGPQTEQERLIADTLYAGLQALDGDRLLTPLRDNAHDHFQRVLALEPDNAVALEGLERIVLRYVELAGEASRRGLFADAGELLDNAGFINPEHPELAQARLDLEAERNSDDVIIRLDNREFARRSSAAVSQLGDIARQARQHDAFVLITAPNDELARWMFLEMRSAVPGYRLRGNIELAGQTGVRLRMPGVETND